MCASSCQVLIPTFNIHHQCVMVNEQWVIAVCLLSKHFTSSTSTHPPHYHHSHQPHNHSHALHDHCPHPKHHDHHPHHLPLLQLVEASKPWAASKNERWLAWLLSQHHGAGGFLNILIGECLGWCQKCLENSNSMGSLGKCLAREECLWWKLFRACVSLTPCASGSSTTASTTSTQSTTPTGSIRSTSRPGGASLLQTNKNTFRFQLVRCIFDFLLIFCILYFAGGKS